MDNQNSFGMRRFSLFPPVLKTLIIINVVVFVIQNLLLSVFHIGNVNLESLFFKYFALQPIFTGETFIANSAFYVWQLVTYQFMHAGFMHIFFNLFVLWMFGTELEDKWGKGKFLTFYLLAGIGAGLAQLFVSPMLGSIGPTVGASGSIYGILLAFGLTFPDRSIFMFPFFIPIKAKYFVLIMVAIELIFGFSMSDGVARFAHLGGALTGYLLILFGDKLKIYGFAEKLFKQKPRTEGYDYFKNSTYEPRQEAKIHQFTFGKKKEQEVYKAPTPTRKVAMNLNGEEITQEKIDVILDKISANGYQSLSDKEKYILTELSKKL